MVEHDLDVVRSADFVIDMGPDGGARGGTVVATGTPEDIAKNKDSVTGHYLNESAKQRAAAKKKAVASAKTKAKVKA
jgi:excinuclease ABC subunit A